MNESIEDKCIYHAQSRTKKEMEISRDPDRQWGSFYWKSGCPSCDGLNKRCPNYTGLA